MNLPDTDQLLEYYRRGDSAAEGRLLQRHRDRLRQMIALRLDRRLRPRIDPSDVLQETLAEAARKLADYARDRPLPFYPWLRRLAWERLVQLHRWHVRTGKRSVRREEAGLPLPDESAVQLADRLASRGSSPSAPLHQAEMRARVQEALARLSERDREVLVLRYLEHLSTREIAAVLGLAESGVKTRQLRALQRLRDLLDDRLAEDMESAIPSRTRTRTARPRAAWPSWSKSYRQSSKPAKQSSCRPISRPTRPTQRNCIGSSPHYCCSPTSRAPAQPASHPSWRTARTTRYLAD
jgi:RNA polymerase sigma-70 factor (ECF subfamily)